jgi:hypothetical protein
VALDLKTYLETLAYAVAILAAGGSAWQYRRNSARERTRWLFDLYQRFYDRSEFKALRVRLDSGDTRFIETGDDPQLLADLDDFLNFFEFTAFLARSGELRKREIRAMFDYTLRMLANDRSALAYIRKYGYEELDSLLKDLGYAT